VTSRLGTGKPLIFFYSVLELQCPFSQLIKIRISLCGFAEDYALYRKRQKNSKYSGEVTRICKEISLEDIPV
jgi:hypothetical protein